MDVLVVRGLTKEFRGFRAVDNVDLRVEEGTVHALVGPNGAGKTTFFNMLTGFITPTAGQILFSGEDVTRLPPEEMTRRKMARSFQVTSLFEHLTALEHVTLALQSATNMGYRFWQSEKRLNQFNDDARTILNRVGLADVARRQAGSLPYGQKRALEMALVLALEPRLLLLDEPTAGMSMDDVGRMIALIKQVRVGKSVVLVEHNMGVVSELADRVTVLQRGTVLAEGTYAEVRDNPKVIDAYLGQTHA
jgi:branched-chain amino acid transport system ATP-binding protein